MILHRPTLVILLCILALMLAPANRSAATEIGGDTSSDGTASATRAMAGGAIGGVLGFSAGFLLGVAMEGSSDNEYAGLEYGILLGSVVGGLTLPLGAHAGNKGRGNPWLVVGTSVAVGAAGWALALTFDQAFLLPMTAVGQLVACTAVEMGTTPDADSPPTAKLSIGPATIDGKPGFVIAGTF